MLDELLRVPPGAIIPHVVIPFANDPDIISAVGEAIRLNIAQFIMIGDKESTVSLADEQNVDIAGSEFVQECDGVRACNLAAQMVSEGRAQILMKGLVQTSIFSKAFLNRDYGLVAEDSIVSHIAFFEIPGYAKPLMITDAALNIAPNLEAKKRILRNAVMYAVSLGIDKPNVACVAAVEKVNPKIISTTDAETLRIAGEHNEFGDAVVDGPFGFDVAVSRAAADTKGISSPVAGNADILLMPGIDAANVLYKTLTRFTMCRLACSIAGAKVPIVLTSRADSEETRLLSLALAARMARATADAVQRRSPRC